MMVQTRALGRGDPLGIISFLTFIGHAFSYQAKAIRFYLLSGPESRVDPPWQIRCSRSVSTPKIHVFSAMFSSFKKPGKRFPRPPKKSNSDPEIHKKRFLRKADFRNTFLVQTSNFESHTPEFRFRNRWKKQRANMPEEKWNRKMSHEPLALSHELWTIKHASSIKQQASRLLGYDTIRIWDL